jgi:signal peptidase II
MMERYRFQRFALHLGLALVIAVADVLLKTQVMNFLFSRETSFYPIIPGFNLNVVWNTGVSFGIFRDSHPELLLGITGGLVTGLGVWLYKTEKKLERWALSLIIGGALGNMRDRLLYGAVFDFLDLYVGKHHWPAFNLADSSIVVGVGLLLYSQIIQDKKA